MLLGTSINFARIIQNFLKECIDHIQILFLIDGGVRGQDCGQPKGIFEELAGLDLKLKIVGVAKRGKDRESWS